jgi:hypothetical protein
MDGEDDRPPVQNTGLGQSTSLAQRRRQRAQEKELMARNNAALLQKHGTLVADATGLPVVVGVIIAGFYNSSKGFVEVRVVNNFLSTEGNGLPYFVVRAERSLQSLLATLDRATIELPLRFEYVVDGLANGADPDLRALHKIAQRFSDSVTVAEIVDHLQPVQIQIPTCRHCGGEALYPQLYCRAPCGHERVGVHGDEMHGRIHLTARLAHTPTLPRPTHNPREHMAKKKKKKITAAAAKPAMLPDGTPLLGSGSEEEPSQVDADVDGGSDDMGDPENAGLGVGHPAWTEEYRRTSKAGKRDVSDKQDSPNGRRPPTRSQRTGAGSDLTAHFPKASKPKGSSSSSGTSSSSSIGASSKATSNKTAVLVHDSIRTINHTTIHAKL